MRAKVAVSGVLFAPRCRSCCAMRKPGSPVAPAGTMGPDVTEAVPGSKEVLAKTEALPVMKKGYCGRCLLQKSTTRHAGNGWSHFEACVSRHQPGRLRRVSFLRFPAREPLLKQATVRKSNSGFHQTPPRRTQSTENQQPNFYQGRAPPPTPYLSALLGQRPRHCGAF